MTLLRVRFKFRLPLGWLAPILLLTAWSISWTGAQADWSEGTDSAMYEDPLFEFPEQESRFSPDVIPLWLTALNSQEADLQCQAANTITWSRLRGMQGLQAVIQPLTRNLTAENHRLVPLASAEALIALDARGAAEALFRQSQADNLDMVQLIEPVLGRWEFAPMIDLWRKRLTGRQIDRRRMLLAIRGLGALNDTPSGSDLRRIAIDAAQSPDLRLAAGEALGGIAREGLEGVASELIQRNEHSGPLERLVAARMVRWHSLESAQKLLIELAQDDESSVAVVALRRLEELEPGLILPLAEDALKQGDANVRRVVAQALIDRPVDTSLVMLGDLLDDPIPDLRIFVRQSLETLAQSVDLRDPIIAQGTRMLGVDHWQGQEQSMKLLVHLNDKSATNRFLGLLEHPRAEVYVTAAWALRKTAVDETLEPLLEFAKARNEKRSEMVGRESDQAGVDEQLSQILQFFGQKKYTSAESFLLTFVPKDLEIFETRAAAVWSLGYLYEGNPDSKLVQQLSERLLDNEGLFPELVMVRTYAAVSLGRMKARDALPALERFDEPDGIQSRLGYACNWAIREITGREFEPPVPTFRYHTNFFLEPLNTDR